MKYDASVKSIRKRVVPELDDEFAKDLGNFENLEALRARVRADLEHEQMHENEREIRGELLKQLAERVTVDVPPTLLEREIDRRVEEFVRRLIEQQVDPMRTNINWEEFREQAASRPRPRRSRARSSWTRSRGARTSPSATPTWTRRSRATRNGAGARRPPSAHASKKKADSAGFMQVSAGNGPWNSCSQGRPASDR